MLKWTIVVLDILDVALFLLTVSVFDPSPPAKMVGNNVCIVGAGLVGLLATKNLKEQGLEVTTFTKDDYIGGLWHMSNDPEKTTALRQTSSNTSKHTVSASLHLVRLQAFKLTMPRIVSRIFRCLMNSGRILPNKT